MQFYRHCRHKTDEIIEDYLRRLLKMEIELVHGQIYQLRHSLINNMEQIKNTIHTNEFQKLKYWMQRDYHNIFHKVKRTQINKFIKLCNQKKNFITNKTDWVINLSTNTNSPDDILNFLALDPKMSIKYTKKDFPLLPLLKDIEYIIGRLENDDTIPHFDKDRLRLACTNIITNNRIEMSS